MEHARDRRAKCALLVLCGLPGSGKTTIVAGLRKQLKMNNGKLIPEGSPCEIEVVTFDDWLHNQLHMGHFSAEAWQQSRQAALQYLLDLLDRKIEAHREGAPYCLLIADDNNHLRRCVLSNK